jgi:hypothetical protein
VEGVSDDKAKFLAGLVRELEQLEREKSEYMTEYKDRRTKLENALAAASNDVLSGQVALPLEAKPGELPLAPPPGPPSQEAVTAAERYPS